MFGLMTGSTTDADDGGLKPKTFDDYDKAVREGFPQCERSRMAASWENLRYAEGYFDDLDAQRGGTTTIRTSERFDAPEGDDVRYDKMPYSLAQPVAKRITGKLSEHLYKRSPTRSLADKKVNGLVEEIYKRNAMAALWQRADFCTVPTGFVAFQYSGDDDPACPVKVLLWSGDQLCVWTDPADATKVVAVATLEKVDGRTRATLWADGKVAKYTTKRDQTVGSGTRTFEPIGPPTDNPYRLPPGTDEFGDETEGESILPFSFAHFSFPATEFTADCPGTSVKELNRYINFGFDDLADGVRYLTKPIGVAEGVAEDWEAPSSVRPGMFLNLSAGQVDAGGNGPQPKLGYLSADNGFVGVIWSHLNNFLDLAMEMEGVPPSTVRMVLDARSGVSIMAEQAPLLGWTEQRRRPFELYERRAVVKLLQVLASHMRTHGIGGSEVLDAAALDPGLALRWPRLYVDLPGPERDRADGTRLQWGQASLIDILMEREDLTREQAIEQLTQVAKDAKLLIKLGIEPLPAVLQAAGQQSALPPPPGMAALPPPSDNTSNAGPPPVAGEPVDPNADADSMSQEGG